MVGATQYKAVDASLVRSLTWLRQIYSQPLFNLIQQARNVYLDHWNSNEVQLCTLLSIKTGGCSEDCSYCAQSARYDAGIEADRLMATDEVMEVARRAKASGTTGSAAMSSWTASRWAK